MIDEVLYLRQRPAMPYLPHAVHDVQHRFRPQRLDRTHHSDQRVSKRVRCTVCTRHIVKCAIGQVLESSGDAGRRVILHGRHIDNLCDLMSHDAGHVGSGLPFSEKIGITIDIGVVSAARRERLLDAHDSNPWRQ